MLAKRKIKVICGMAGEVDNLVRAYTNRSLRSGMLLVAEVGRKDLSPVSGGPRGDRRERRRHP